MSRELHEGPSYYIYCADGFRVMWARGSCTQAALRMWVRLSPDTRNLWGLVPVLTGRQWTCTLSRKGHEAVSWGCLCRPEPAKEVVGKEVCSKARCDSPALPAPPALSLAAATPASPGCIAKLFNAAVSRQSESWAPQASLPQQRTWCGRNRRRRPSHSAPGTSEGLPETSHSRAPFRKRLEGPERPGERPSSSPHTARTPSFTHLEFAWSERGALPPPTPYRCTQAVNRLLMN